jgi:hypothetical protein
MRLLAVSFVIAIAGSTAAAADKDEDKAKEATLAFLKAVKAKDLDAVMKTVDVPFLAEDKEEPITKIEDLKAKLMMLLEKAKPERIPNEVSKVLDAAAVLKLLEEKKNPKSQAAIEKVIGKTGYAAILLRDGKERGAILVQVKDGKAKVVGIAD